MAIEFIDEGKDYRIVKCIVLTKPIVDRVKAIVDKHPGMNQSAVICKILSAYFASIEETV